MLEMVVVVVVVVNRVRLGMPVRTAVRGWVTLILTTTIHLVVAVLMSDWRVHQM